MNATIRQPITLSQAAAVLAFGYLMVVLLALASSVTITAQFATNLALSQCASAVVYGLFRSWYSA
jgi:hypothetical protein